MRHRNIIFDHIEEDNPAAAAKMDKIFLDAASSIEASPEIGRRGTLKGTRELIVHKTYRLVYEIHEDVILITALVSTSQKWP